VTGDGVERRLNSDSVVWSDSAERLIYQKGRKIISSTVDGKDKETVWKTPDIGYSAQICGIADEYMVVREGKTSSADGLSTGNGNYYIVNLLDGTVTETDISATVYKDIICAYDGYIYWFDNDVTTHDGIFTHRLNRCSIETGKNEQLAQYEGENPKTYCMAGDKIFYNTSYGEVYAISLDTYDSVKLELDNKISLVEAYGDNLYMVYNTAGDNCVYANVIKSNGTDAPENVITFEVSDENYTVTALCVSGDTVTICTDENVYMGETEKCGMRIIR
jgi:hypothetical protein